MRLYEIILPRLNNEGAPMDSAHQAFARKLCVLYGGFTRAPVQGTWLDDTGKAYQDESFAYRIATDRALGHAILAAQRLWPDQLAIFWASLGEAHIYETPAGRGARIAETARRAAGPT